MPKQRVKFERYLVKAVINLADIKAAAFDAVTLPANAEVMSVNVEVLEAASSGTTLDVGLDTVGDRFINDVDLSVANVNFQSSVVTMTNDAATITVTPNQESSQGKIVLRVDYVLPSEVMTEY